MIAESRHSVAVECNVIPSQWWTSSGLWTRSCLLFWIRIHKIENVACQIWRHN